MKKINREKLAAWSFPIFMGIVAIGLLTYFGAKWTISKAKVMRANIGYTITENGYTYELPCKVNNSSDGLYDCKYDGFGYRVDTERKKEGSSYELKPCEERQSVYPNVANEDYSYKRKYNNLDSIVCVHLSNTERGVNSGYRSISAEIDSPQFIHHISISGPTAYHDIYSEKMDKVLRSFKVKD